MTQISYAVFEPGNPNIVRAGMCQDYELASQAGPGQTAVQIPTESTYVVEMNLDPVKASFAAQVDAAAEAARETLITGGSGQAMTYLAKQAEAAAYLANSSAPTPFLTAEAAATGTTVAALAAVVQAQAAAWQTAGAAIEAKRRKAKLDIAAATTLEAVHAAAQVDWATVAPGN